MIDYSSSIVVAANKYGVSPDLALAIAKAESGMNPNAVSNKGAIGLFQLMPSTAASLGVDPNDPIQNIDGGVSYFASLLNKYGGDTSLALAAYNAGPGNVQKYGGIPPFEETRSYIDRVLGWIGGSSGTNTVDSASSANSVGSDLVYNAQSEGLGLSDIVVPMLVGLGIVLLFRK